MLANAILESSFQLIHPIPSITQNKRPTSASAGTLLDKLTQQGHSSSAGRKTDFRPWEPTTTGQCKWPSIKQGIKGSEIYQNIQTEYTHFSSAHGNFSRIDHMRGFKRILSEFKKIEIISSICFPNAVLWDYKLTTRIQLQKNTNVRSLNNMLLNNQWIT